MNKEQKKEYENYIIGKYRETILSKTEQKRIYFLKLESEDGQINLDKIKGHYIIDQYDQKWMSECLTKQLFKDINSINSKVFDINSDNQFRFFNLNEVKNSNFKLEISRILLKIIQNNSRKGSPRRFLTNNSGEKVNIELKYDTKSSFMIQEGIKKD